MDELKWARELHGEGGASIAALYGYKADFERARSACQRIIQEFQSKKPDNDLTDLLWAAAVVNYMRPFQRDGRQSLPEGFVESLSNENRVAHRYIVGVRNKHIAHSENSMETVIAFCMLANPDVEEPSVKGIGAMTLRRGFGPKDAVDLLNLAREAQAWLEDLTGLFTTHIREQVEALPLADLYDEPSVATRWIEAGGSSWDKRPKVRFDSTPIRLA